MCMLRTYRPEVVDQYVEDAKNDDEKRSAPLGLEAHHDHDACEKANDGDDDSADGPGSTENKAHEEEDEQHAAGELDVHLAVLFLNLRQAGEDLGLAHPRVGEHHEEAAHDGQVAQEEVDVENKAVAEGLGDHDADEATDGVFRVFASDDEDGARGHGDHVDDEEEVRNTAGNWTNKQD